jgi:putative transposase
VVTQPGANGPSATKSREDARLAAEIQSLFLENRQVYGSPRIHVALRDRGWRCGRKRVVRLMHAMGLCARPHHRRKPVTTNSDPTAHFAPNKLGRDFSAERPNTKWVTDITAIPTRDRMGVPGCRSGLVLPHGGGLGDGSNGG